MTTQNEGELSTFVLDVYWASGRAPNAAVEAHLVTCERCRGYLGTLEGLQAAAGAAPLPARPATTMASPRAASILRGTSGRRVLAGLGTLSLAASVALFLRAKSTANAAYVGVKGAPGVQVLVHRGSTTRVWDGRSSVRPGDALALRVACRGSNHVAVASPGTTDWQLLSDVLCPSKSDWLPFTLVVDDRPGSERLAVVLSRDPMDERRLRKAISETRRTSDVWVEQFVLPKEIDR